MHRTVENTLKTSLLRNKLDSQLVGKMEVTRSIATVEKGTVGTVIDPQIKLMFSRSL